MDMTFYILLTNRNGYSDGLGPYDSPIRKIVYKGMVPW